jgi:hypothetical protein
MCSVVFAMALVSAVGSPPAPQAETGGAPVTVVFRALSPDGQPVLDIKLEEVSLKVQGRARVAGSLKLIQFGAGTSEGKAAPSTPAPFATNEVSNLARTILLLIDDESMAAGREGPVKDAVAALLASAPAHDRIGLMTVPRGGANVSPSTDRAKLREAIASIRGRASRGETAADAICRTGVTLESLKAVFESYSWESLTTMVYISGGLSPAMTSGAQIGRSSGVCELQREAYVETAGAALQSPIDLYVASVPDDTSAATSSEQLSGLEHLSALTGNQLIRIGGTSKSLMDRLLRETSAYYVLSFDPESSERNNNRHRVDLKTSRERVEIRAKPEVLIAKAGPRSGGPRGPAVKDMLRVGTAFRELPLRAVTHIARDSGDRLKLVTIFEPIEPGTVLASGAIALFDDKGKLISQTTAQSNELASGTVVSALTAKAGSYRLRVAAIDGNGRRGAVDQDLRVELTQAEGVKLSSIVLGRPTNQGFTPTLQFGSDLVATGYLEVYGAPKTAVVTATFELATTPDGKPFATASGLVAQPKTEDVRLVSADISIGAIMPGDFVLRVLINVDGRPAARAATTLRKVLR